MRKSRGIFARAFAATMVIWLGLVITEPMPFDACPMHGTHALHGVAAAAHAGHHAAHGGNDAQKKHRNQCTCIGDCNVGGGSFASAVPELVSAPEAVVTKLVQRASPNDIVSFGGLREHTLPPANGPPSIS